MKLKNLLATRVRKLAACGISIIIIASLTNFFTYNLFVLNVLTVLFSLSLLYPIYFLLATLWYAIKNLFKK